MIRGIWSWLLLLRVEIAQDPLTDVLNVRCPVAEKGIGNTPHGLQLVLHNGVEAIFCILTAFFDRLRNARQDHGILQDEHMSFEDTALSLIHI